MKEFLYPIAHMFEDCGKKNEDLRVTRLGCSLLIIFDQSFKGR